MEKKSKEEMPSSINMPLTENKKSSMKEHIDKSLAVSSKVVVQNKKNYLKDEGKICDQIYLELNPIPHWQPMKRYIRVQGYLKNDVYGSQYSIMYSESFEDAASVGQLRHKQSIAVINFASH